MTAIFVKSVRTAFGLLLLHSDLKKSPLEKRPLTDLFNAPPVMYASRIYVTSLVPCLVDAVDFLLYKLHVFWAAVSSYLSSLHTLELHIQVHQLCTNNKHNTYLDPPLGGFGWKASTHVQGHDYFIPTKFIQLPSVSSVRKANMCFHTYTCISDPPPPPTNLPSLK